MNILAQISQLRGEIQDLGIIIPPHPLNLSIDGLECVHLALGKPSVWRN